MMMKFTIDQLLLPKELPITRSNEIKLKKNIALTEQDLQGELGECRELLVLISQHINSLLAAIEYRKPHPINKIRALGSTDESFETLKELP